MLVPSSPDDPAHDANVAAWVGLAAFPRPFLTAFGDSDPITTGSDRVLRERIAGAQGQPHTTIVGGGHFLQEDRGEDLARVVVDFVARDPPQSSLSSGRRHRIAESMRCDRPAIGVVVGGRTEPVDDNWGMVESVIRLESTRFENDAVAGLEAFSHLCVVFHFHLVEEADVVTGARHPPRQSRLAEWGCSPKEAECGPTGWA